MDVHLTPETEKKLTALSAQRPGPRVADRGGARVFKDTRMPVSVVFQNLEAGATADEIVAWFDVTPERVKTVIEFAARSLEAPAHGR